MLLNNMNSVPHLHVFEPLTSVYPCESFVSRGLVLLWVSSLMISLISSPVTHFLQASHNVNVSSSCTLDHTLFTFCIFSGWSHPVLHPTNLINSIQASHLNSRPKSPLCLPRYMPNMLKPEYQLFNMRNMREFSMLSKSDLNSEYSILCFLLWCTPRFNSFRPGSESCFS